jgi:hypothetical protein
MKPRIQVGNTQRLERRRKIMKEMERHERNKEAWYERNVHLARDDWMGGGFEKNYAEGGPHSSMDEDDMFGENEDGSEDEGEREDESLNGDSDVDAMELELLIRTQREGSAAISRSGTDSVCLL